MAAPWTSGAHEPPESPEPIAWRHPPPLAQRVMRAVGAPAVVGGAVLLAAIVISVVLALLRPHAWEGAGAADPAGTQAVSSSAEGASGASGRDSGADGSSNAGSSESGASGSGETAGAEGSAEGSGRVFVHVVGEVREPGVYELPGGARVQAALEAAGGPTKKAVLSGVNLARAVLDGEQIAVPNAREAAALSATAGGPAAPDGAAGPGSGAAGTGAAGTGAAGSGAGGGSANGTGLVNLNTADSATLQTLPRIGPALAQRIIEWREANGGFSAVDQLTSVTGIGEKTFEGMRDRVTVR